MKTWLIEWQWAFPREQASANYYYVAPTEERGHGICEATTDPLRATQWSQAAAEMIAPELPHNPAAGKWVATEHIFMTKEVPA